MGIFHVRLLRKSDISKLDFELVDILNLIDKSSQSNWLIRFNYNDDIVFKKNVAPYELLSTLGAIEIKDRYYLLDGESVFKFSEEIFQTNFIVLIAVPINFKLEAKEEVNVVDYGDTLSNIQLTAGKVEIRAVDSSYFEVLSKDETIIKKLISNFVKYEFII